MSQSPRRFRPYKTGDEAGPDAETQRIERDDETPWQDMLNNNPDWRANRRTKGAARTGGLNQQRITNLMDNGGWKYIAAGAAAFIVLLIIFLVTRGGDDQPLAVDPLTGNNGVTSNPQDGFTDPANSGGPILVDQTPTIPSSEPPPAEPGPGTSTGATLVVVDTGVEGLFLRDQPGGSILKTLPEGSLVEKLGEQQLPERVWFNIRDVSSGLEGWAAGDFLAPSQ